MPRQTMQDHAKLVKLRPTTPGYVKPRETKQDYTKPRKTTPDHSKPRPSMSNDP